MLSNTKKMLVLFWLDDVLAIINICHFLAFCYKALLNRPPSMFSTWSLSVLEPILVTDQL